MNGNEIFQNLMVREWTETLKEMERERKWKRDVEVSERSIVHACVTEPKSKWSPFTTSHFVMQQTIKRTIRRCLMAFEFELSPVSVYYRDFSDPLVIISFSKRLFMLRA